MNIDNEFPREYLDGSVLVFLDDVLIYSTCPEEKAEYLKTRSEAEGAPVDHQGQWI